MARLAILSTGVLSAALSVRAWGNLGHETIGFVAQQFLAPKALTFVQSTLNSTWNFSLGPAAIWADQVKSETAFKWSADLHFVDAQDSPLTGECSVDEQRDCADQDCILAAIANYTTRVVQKGLAKEQTLEALLFLGLCQPVSQNPRADCLSTDHFLGDIGQPLHVEALEVGGNDISAKCSGESSTNLHAVWDTGMVTKHIDQAHGGTPQQYAADLVAEIQTGAFAAVAASWLACSSTTEPLSARAAEPDFDSGPGAQLERELTALARRANDATAAAAITPLECPIVWARESNAFDCTVVFNFTTGEDLCSGTYFDNAVPVAQL
ncbi:hypothetical protein GSI_01447 [Ganoderma sinense ZZ0214-1]|uniref:Nuclease Le1 n=1 Tax=Ganoderma sinense ZZ0214-1 TaxID=1077348 RepID=A0A2G8SVN0_9APHY|nr:hypothetical protein GSI_01447 [Ganoderma sinense ZZ0214-1]